MANNSPALNLLITELQTIKNQAKYDDYNITIDTDFTKYAGNIGSKDIFVIIRMQEGTIGYGSIFVNARLECISEQKNVEVCREFLYEFSTTYNLVPKTFDSKYIIQSYTTPANSSEFVKYQSGLASLLYVDCSFSMSSNISVVEEIKVDTFNLEFLTINFGYVASVDSKSYPFTTNAYTKSVVQCGTNALTIQAFFNLNNAAILKCLYITQADQVHSQDYNFNIQLKIGGIWYNYNNMKLVTFNINQTRDALPAVVMSFSQ